MHYMKDELKSHQIHIANILKHHFLDYESHSNTTSIGHQIQLLEQHIITLKESAHKRTEAKSRSNQKSWNEEFA